MIIEGWFGIIVVCSEFMQLFTTKYDEQMEQILFKSYNNSLSLLDTLKSNSQNLSYLLDNMMLNIILI